MILINTKKRKFEIANNIRFKVFFFFLPFHFFFQNLTNEGFFIKVVRKASQYTYAIEDFNGKKIVSKSHKIDFKKIEQNIFRTKKVVK